MSLTKSATVYFTDGKSREIEHTDCQCSPAGFFIFITPTSEIHINSASVALIEFGDIVRARTALVV